MTIRVAVDAMGGDFAPVSEVAGAVAACQRWGCDVVLVGDEVIIKTELAKHQTDDLKISIQHASQVVGMEDSASDAVRKKKDSSIRVAFDLVKSGVAHAVVSTGNSGATMAAGMFVLRRVKGIDRPAIGTLLPNVKGMTLVLDIGANVDCKPLNLQQFAIMGSLYMQHVAGIKAPRIGLLSNGEEAKKGTELTREAHQLLLETELNYVGNVEGGDVFNGAVDVVVCDGFVGNVLLKVSEGLAVAMTSMLRSEIEGRFLSKVGALLSRSAFRAFKKKVDPCEYGGAPLLGLAGTGVVCHGKATPLAIAIAIRQAHEFASIKIEEKLAHSI
jgi:glycerol-3-phosphate acyltransferase PlsX